MSEPPTPEWEHLEARRLFPGLRATVRGLHWEVVLVGPSWVNLRPMDGGDTRAAYYRGKGLYTMDDEAVSFEGLEDVDAARAERLQQPIVRQLEGLISNTMRAVQALESKLTPEERSRILGIIAQAKEARGHGDLTQLEACLLSLETAAGLIGEAMLRR